MAQEYASNRNSKEYKRKKERDSKCYLCGDCKIVDKISNGTVYINHCNNCGNQWRKYKISHTWSYDIFTQWINGLNDFNTDEQTFKNTTIQQLKDIPAESILNIINKYGKDCHGNVKENLTLSYLRTKFKSVYDNN